MEATSSYLLAPALDTVSPSVWSVRVAARRCGCLHHLHTDASKMYDKLLHQISPRITKNSTSHTLDGREGNADDMDGGRADEGRCGRWQSGRRTL